VTEGDKLKLRFLMEKFAEYKNFLDNEDELATDFMLKI